MSQSGEQLGDRRVDIFHGIRQVFDRLWLLVLITVGAPPCDAFASGVLYSCKLESVPSMEILQLGLYHSFLQQGGKEKLEQEHMIFSGDIRHTMAMDQYVSTWNISFLRIFAILWPWINTYQHGTYLFWGYSPYYGHGSIRINMEHIFSGDIRHTMAMDQYISIHINMEHIFSGDIRHTMAMDEYVSTWNISFLGIFAILWPWINTYQHGTYLFFGYSPYYGHGSIHINMEHIFSGDIRHTMAMDQYISTWNISFLGIFAILWPWINTYQHGTYLFWGYSPYYGHGSIHINMEHMIFSGDIRHNMAMDQYISTWNISFLGIFAILWPWINTYQHGTYLFWGYSPYYGHGSIHINMEHIFSGDIRHTMAMDQYVSTWNISFLGIFAILWPWINTYQHGTYLFWGYSPYYGHGSIHINMEHIFSGDIRHTMAMDQYISTWNISFLGIFAILWPWINTYQHGTYLFWGYSPYHGHGSIRINMEHIFSGDIRHIMAMDQYVSTWNISFLGIFAILWPWINTYQHGTYLFWGYSPYYGHGSIHINMEHIFSGDIRHIMAMDQYVYLFISTWPWIITYQHGTYLFWGYSPYYGHGSIHINMEHIFSGDIRHTMAMDQYISTWNISFLGIFAILWPWINTYQHGTYLFWGYSPYYGHRSIRIKMEHIFSGDIRHTMAMDQYISIFSGDIHIHGSWNISFLGIFAILWPWINTYQHGTYLFWGYSPYYGHGSIHINMEHIFSGDIRHTMDMDQYISTWNISFLGIFAILWPWINTYQHGTYLFFGYSPYYGHGSIRINMEHIFSGDIRHIMAMDQYVSTWNISFLGIFAILWPWINTYQHGTYLFWGYSPYYGHGSIHINMEHIFSGDIRHTMAMDQYISTWNISFLGIFAILWPWINTYQHGTYLFWGYSPYYGHGSIHINMEHMFSGDIRHTMAMDQYISIHINMEHIITYLFWRYLP